MELRQHATPYRQCNPLSYSNFYAFQQGVLIYLLNKSCDIMVKRPRMQSMINKHCPKIIELNFEHEVLDIVQIAKQHCQPLFERDILMTSKLQTAKRRFHKNKKVFTQNLLIDILNEQGFLQLTDGKEQLKDIPTGTYTVRVLS